ncbi:glutamic acid-rcih protein, putative [Eimeria tenella]|uniref:Glutamic acid-rcih protein, putative n=1 Tax=Eimeria tenella TaxID=5802 RepID=U6KWF2_EIMTE|nr:glutamic acid-rcih protein, putative [Eimeria tenella]CDJ41258.1 glutamic acid-rcih protein, putative [Eimeria tenella]|eukprot:XP_013232008.1 glutamic acid-rcih protein, putative [Eimeria tenella]
MLKQQQKQQGEEVGDCPYVRLASNLTAASAAAPTTLAATTARDAAEEALQMCCCNMCGLEASEEGDVSREDLGSWQTSCEFAPTVEDGLPSSCLSQEDRRLLLREAWSESVVREAQLQQATAAARASTAAANAAASGDAPVLPTAPYRPLLRVVQEDLPPLTGDPCGDGKYGAQQQQQQRQQTPFSFVTIRQIQRTRREPDDATLSADTDQVGKQKNAGSLLLHASLKHRISSPFLDCGSKTHLFFKIKGGNSRGSSNKGNSNNNSSAYPPAHCCCIADVQVHTPSLLLRPSAAARNQPGTSQRLLLHLHPAYLTLLERQQQEEEDTKPWTAAGEALLLRAIWCCRVGEAATFQVYLHSSKAEEQQFFCALSVHVIDILPLPSLCSSVREDSNSKSSSPVTKEQGAPDLCQQQLLRCIQWQKALLLLQRELQQFAAGCIAFLLQQEEHPTPLLRQLLTCTCEACRLPPEPPDAVVQQQQQPQQQSDSTGYSMPRRYSSMSTAAAAARSLFDTAAAQPQRQQQQSSGGKLMGLLLRGRGRISRPKTDREQHQELQQLPQQSSGPVVRSLSRQGLASTLRRLRSRSIDKLVSQQQRQQQQQEPHVPACGPPPDIAAATAGGVTPPTALRMGSTASDADPGSKVGPLRDTGGTDLLRVLAGARRISLALFLSDFKQFLDGACDNRSNSVNKGNRDDFLLLMAYRRRLRDLLLQGVCIQGVIVQLIGSTRLWQQLQQEQRAAQAGIWRQQEMPLSPLFLLLELGGLRFFVCPAQLSQQQQSGVNSQLPLLLFVQRFLGGYQHEVETTAAAATAAVERGLEKTGINEKLQEQQQDELWVPLAVTDPLPSLPHSTVALAGGLCADADALEAAGDTFWMVQQRLSQLLNDQGEPHQQRKHEELHKQCQEECQLRRMYGLVFEVGQELPSFIPLEISGAATHKQRQQAFLRAAVAAAAATAEGALAVNDVEVRQQHIWQPIQHCPHVRQHSCACDSVADSQLKQFCSSSSRSRETFCHRCRVAAAPITWPAAAAAAAADGDIPATDYVYGESYVWTSECAATCFSGTPIESTSVAVLPKASLKCNRCCSLFSGSGSSNSCSSSKCSSTWRNRAKAVAEAFLRWQIPHTDGPTIQAALRREGISAGVGLWLVFDELLVLLHQDPMQLPEWCGGDRKAAAAAASAAAAVAEKRSHMLPCSSKTQLIATAAACALLGCALQKVLRYEQQICCSCCSATSVCRHFSDCTTLWAFSGGAKRLMQEQKLRVSPSVAAAAQSAAAPAVPAPSACNPDISESCLLLFHRRVCLSLALSLVRAHALSPMLLPLPVLLRFCISTALRSPSVLFIELQQQHHALPLCRYRHARQICAETGIMSVATAGSPTGTPFECLQWGRVAVKPPLPNGTACLSVLLLTQLVLHPAKVDTPLVDSQDLYGDGDLVGAPLLDRWWLDAQGALAACTLPFQERQLRPSLIRKVAPTEASLPHPFKAPKGFHGEAVKQILSPEFIAAAPAALRGGLLCQLLLLALAPPEPKLWTAYRIEQEQHIQQQQQQPHQQQQPGYVLGRRLDGISAWADDHLLRLLMLLLLQFDSWLGFSGLSEQQKADCPAVRQSAAEAVESDGSRLVPYGLEGGFCAPGSNLRQHQLNLFAALSNAVEGIRLGGAQGAGHPFASLLSWLLLLIAYCGCAIPDAALSRNNMDNSGSSATYKNEIVGSLVETAAAATARVGVYSDLLRVLRLRLGVCPLPVGPPHLVPRHLPLLPLLSVDKRVLPAECKGVSGFSGDCNPADTAAVAADSSSPVAAQQRQKLQQSKPSVLAPSELARPTSPLARKQQEQASRLFGCTYTPKYPEHRHCHLPDPLLQPHVSCAVVLYNLKRLGAPVIHWSSAICPRGDLGDPAAEWAVAAVVGSAAAVGANDPTTYKSQVKDVEVEENSVSLPPYALKGECCEHVLQWLQWQQQPQPLLFTCGLNEEGPLGLGEAAYFPVDPVLEERDNFIKAAKGTDVWFCCQPQQVVALPGEIRSVSAGLNSSAAVTSQGHLFSWGAVDGYAEDTDSGSSSGSNGSICGILRRHPADHSRDHGLREALRFSWLDLSLFWTPTSAAGSQLVIGQKEAAKCSREQQQQQEVRVFLPALLGGNRCALSPRNELSRSGPVFSAVCCGPDFCAALTVTGSLYTWGHNASGVLGHGDTHSRSQPTPLSLDQFLSPFVDKQQHPQQHLLQVACGNSHMAAVTAAGCLFVWGSNNHGQCGLSKETNIILFPQQLLLLDLSCVPLSMLTLIHSIVATNGSVNSTSTSQGGWFDLGYAPKGDTRGALVTADAAGLSFLVEEGGAQLRCLADYLIRFSQVACGSLHTISLGTTSGPPSEVTDKAAPKCLYTWGSNTNNCLGFAAPPAMTVVPPARIPDASFFVEGLQPKQTQQQQKPHQQPQQQTLHIKQISAGGITSAALSDTGDLWLWGDVQSFVTSDDSPEWSAALPMPFELVEDVGFFLQQKNPERVRLSLSSVAFAAEGARLLLLTKEGDLIAVGDGCVQQQLLSVHLTKQKLLQQQQDSWNTAAATIAPRFWADKSRQQRLRGACRIHVPHRRIVEGAAGLDHFLLKTVASDAEDHLLPEKPLEYLMQMHRPPPELRCRHPATPSRSGSSSSSTSSASNSGGSIIANNSGNSNSISSSSSSTADCTRMTSYSSSSGKTSTKEPTKPSDTSGPQRPSVSLRSHSATPACTANSGQQELKQRGQQHQANSATRQLWEATSATSSSGSTGLSFAAAAREAAAAGLHLTLRHLASAGEEAAKAAAARAAEAAEKVVDGPGAAVMEGLLDHLDRQVHNFSVGYCKCVVTANTPATINELINVLLASSLPGIFLRGSGVVLSALSSGISYILPRCKVPATSATASPAAATKATAIKKTATAKCINQQTRDVTKGAHLVAAPVRHSGAIPCRPPLPFPETQGPEPVPAVRVGLPHALGASLRPLLPQRPPQYPWEQQQQQQQQQRKPIYSMPPRSQSLTTLPSYVAEQRGNHLQQKPDPMLQQQLEAERQEAWERLTSIGRLNCTASATIQRLGMRSQVEQQLPLATRSLRGGTSAVQLPDIPQQQQQHCSENLKELLKSNTAPAVLHRVHEEAPLNVVPERQTVGAAAAAAWEQQQQRAERQQLQRQVQQQMEQQEKLQQERRQKRQQEQQQPSGWTTPSPSTSFSGNWPQQLENPVSGSGAAAAALSVAAADEAEDEGTLNLLYYPQHDTMSSNNSRHSLAAAALVRPAWQQQQQQLRISSEGPPQHLTVPSFSLAPMPLHEAAAASGAAQLTYTRKTTAASFWPYSGETLEQQQQKQMPLAPPSFPLSAYPQQQKQQQHQQIFPSSLPSAYSQQLQQQQAPQQMMVVPASFPPSLYPQKQQQQHTQQQQEHEQQQWASLACCPTGGVDGLSASYLPQHSAAYFPAQDSNTAPATAAVTATALNACNSVSLQNDNRNSNGALSGASFYSPDTLESVLLDNQQLLRQMQQQQMLQQQQTAAHGILHSNAPQKLRLVHPSELISQHQHPQGIPQHQQNEFLLMDSSQYQHVVKQQQQQILQQQRLMEQEQVHARPAWDYGSTLPQQQLQRLPLPEELHLQQAHLQQQQQQSDEMLKLDYLKQQHTFLSHMQ